MTWLTADVVRKLTSSKIDIVGSCTDQLSTKSPWWKKVAVSAYSKNASYSSLGKDNILLGCIS